MRNFIRNITGYFARAKFNPQIPNQNFSRVVPSKSSTRSVVGLTTFGLFAAYYASLYEQSHADSKSTIEMFNEQDSYIQRAKAQKFLPEVLRLIINQIPENGKFLDLTPISLI